MGRFDSSSIQLLRNPRVIVLITSGLFFLIGIGLIVHNHNAHKQTQVIPVDFVQDDTLVPVTLSNQYVPPVEKGGHTLVKAVYATCGMCNDRKLLFLEKFDPQTKAKLEASLASGTGMPSPTLYVEATKAMLVRTPVAGSPWVVAGSAEGQKVTTGELCPGSDMPARPCP